MRTALNRLSFSSWPIWLKLLAGLLLAMMLPVILLLFLTVNSIQEVSSQNVQLFVSESAAEHAREISDMFVQARNDIKEFVQDDANMAQLQKVLPTDSGAVVDPVDKADVIGRFQNSLLNNKNSLFNSVDLVNANGILVSHIEPGRKISLIGGQDLSNTTAYQQGVEAQMVGETQVLSIDTGSDNQPVLDVVNSLSVFEASSRTQVVIGYLIGRTNLAPALAQKFADQPGFPQYEQPPGNQPRPRHRPKRDPGSQRS